ncbi:phenylacetate-CoA ligase [Desulfonauticus submarinus]|uniref:Phenylacetate-coenzyme A ligase n=1 Tax=Desulfonauticus submarinus TaxID=206665 RepID=A0A1H0BT20_9BACT|nr:phenylacetate--CoA ligase [Desulfonauticus submarinus]SDN48814.1 phenylacetate-CoA ligase [Desulfonauticus submarinus]
MNYRFFPNFTKEELAKIQLEGLKWTVNHAYQGSAQYQKKLKKSGIHPNDIKSLEDLQYLPFTTVEDLREGYPLPLLSVPEEEVVRIHASSGTTGKRKVLAYTQKDIDTWKIMLARCFELAGLSPLDRIQIAVGYGLWTAGAGFQLGCEYFGAMAVPIGPGNLDMQLQLLVDFQTTCLCSTASMALLLAEQVKKHQLQSKIALKKAIFGAEPHTPKMRKYIEETLNLEDTFDIPGMTEVYGPGTGLECSAHQGIHYWADLFILEILDPNTLKPVQPGEVGEMVITTLCKEAVPLIRYRTRDLTRFIPGECSCGLNLPRHDHILGRSDDMFIFRGVNIYPGQIATILEQFPELSSEYQIYLNRKQGLDFMTIKVEAQEGTTIPDNLATAVEKNIKTKILVSSKVEIVPPLSLPRSFGKTKRLIDERDN